MKIQTNINIFLILSTLLSISYTGSPTLSHYREMPYTPYGDVSTIGVTQDGGYIAVGGNSGDIQIYTEQFASIGTFSIKGSAKVTAVAYSMDDQKFITAGDSNNIIQIWDCSNQWGYILLKDINLYGEKKNIQVTKDNKNFLFPCDNFIYIYSLTSYDLVKKFGNHTKMVNSANFNANNTKVVSGSVDKTIKIWDCTNNYSEITTITHTEMVLDAKITKYDDLIISADNTGKIQIWYGKLPYHLVKTIDAHTSAINSIALSKDSSRLISASDDTYVKVWDMNNDYILEKELDDAHGPVKRVEIAPTQLFFFTADQAKNLHMYSAHCKSSFTKNGFNCCSTPQSCVTCTNDGYFRDDWECLTCDETRCSTCNSNGTDCQIACKTGCTVCTPKQECTACEIGYYKPTNAWDCLQCDHSVCATCQNTDTNCLDKCKTQCKTCTPQNECNSCNPERYLKNGDCLICGAGNYLDSNQDCLSCLSQCATCSNNTTCDSCRDGFYLSSNDCLQCNHSKCATCVTNSDNCKINCKSDCKTCTKDNLCDSCEAGKYLDSSGNCVSCDSSCKECSGSASHCTACDLGKFLDSNSCSPCDNTKCGTCNSNDKDCGVHCNRDCAQCGVTGTCTKCADGKYLSNLGTCLDCDNTKCGTCKTNATTCVKSCDKGCKTCQTDGKCIDCHEGFFLDNQKACNKCDNTKCATCNTTSIKCDLKCNSGCATCNTTGMCSSCVDGKFVNNGACQDCDNTVCGTCVTDSTTCQIHCQDGCKTCNTDGSCKSCNDGFYEDGGSCLKCDNTKCGTCTGSATSCDIFCESGCTQCDTTGKCSLCAVGEYLTTQKTCEDCDNTKCGTCEDTPTKCVIPCEKNCKECNTAGKCTDCFVGYHLDHEQCDRCDHTKCATCTGQPDICVDKCHSSCKECDTTTQCTKCNEGQFIDNGVCSNCDNTKCATCQNNSQQCIKKCNSDCKECDTAGLCISCEDGYFLNSSTKKCDKCKYDCECVTFEYCSKCFQSDHHLRNPLNCSCKSGYFENSEGNCEQCHFKCKECKGSSDNCTICKGLVNQSTDINSTCECITRFYLDNDTQSCQRCSPLCRSCITQNQCQVCAIPYARPPFCLNFFRSFFDISQENTETKQQQCDLKCKTCSQESSNCTTCSISLNRSAQAPDCNCNSGYHDNNLQTQDCFKCPVLCINCISNQSCQTCSENSEINLESGLCECIEGYKINKKEICQQCYSYQNNCQFECPQFTIKDEQQRICNDIEYIEENSYIIFYISMCILVGISSLSFLALKNILSKASLPRIRSNAINLKEFDVEKINSDGSSIGEQHEI